MLSSTRDGIANVTLYYVAETITTWEDTQERRHSHICCESAFRLVRHENASSETVAIFVCKQDVKNSIHNLQDNFQWVCCDEYVIISTGNWRIEWEIHPVYTDGELDEEKSYALLADGTRCIPDTIENNQITWWKTNDEYEWRIPNPPERKNDDSNLLGYATAHLPFKYNVINTRWAALYHCGNLLVVDRRLESLRCLRCGDDTFVMAPIMDDIDLQRWHFHERYNYSTGGGEMLEMDCNYEGEMWFGKWIHDPRTRQNRRVPNLTAEDESNLASWLDAYPMMGIYIAQNGSLVSINLGAESNGGRDIQEKMPPDPATHPYTPSGRYWYINDRNAAVRYDKKIYGIDQAWDHNCFNIPVRLSAQSLDGLPAAPATQCQGNRGRIVISGNNVLSVFDSEF
jgi:hypothetical protein